VKSTISKPKEILVAFTEATLLGEPAPNDGADFSPAEKPKVEELQMDWLRSET
jgi:hypothetical protein